MLVSFTNEEVKELAERLLNKLYEESEGDEWELLDLLSLYKDICKSFSSDNIGLRHNVLQCLLAHGFILLSPDKLMISITAQGKRYLGKMPSLIEHKEDRPNSPSH